MTAEEYEKEWGWLVAGTEVWVYNQDHGWIPGVVAHTGIPPGAEFESYGATDDGQPMQAFDDAWTVQVVTALNFNSMMVTPVRVLSRWIWRRDEHDAVWRPTTPWHEDRYSPSYSPSWYGYPPSAPRPPPRPLTDAELDMLDEYMAEMATPPPVTYTFTEAELDTLLEWRMGGGM